MVGSVASLPLVELPKRFERPRKVRKRGLRVAIAEAVIPMPGSTVLQIATSVVLYKKSGKANCLRYGMRTTVAVEPLNQNCQRFINPFRCIRASDHGERGGLTTLTQRLKLKSIQPIPWLGESLKDSRQGRWEECPRSTELMSVMVKSQSEFVSYDTVC